MRANFSTAIHLFIHQTPAVAGSGLRPAAHNVTKAVLMAGEIPSPKPLSLPPRICTGQELKLGADLEWNTAPLR